jgi:hypothetical protein
MTAPFTGGCACGAVRYECTAEPLGSINCHCRDCQRASGTAYASVLRVPAASFRVICLEQVKPSLAFGPGPKSKTCRRVGVGRKPTLFARRYSPRLQRDVLFTSPTAI